MEHFREAIILLLHRKQFMAKRNPAHPKLEQ